jgi:hypothetical protein
MKTKYLIDTKIYSDKYILEAIDSFKEVTDISFIDVTLTVSWENKEEIEYFFWEFMNFVIWLINE